MVAKKTYKDVFFMKNLTLSILFLSVFLISCAAPQKREEPAPTPVIVEAPEPPPVVKATPPPVDVLKLPPNATIRDTPRGKVLVITPKIVHFYNAETNMMSGYIKSFDVAKTILDMNPSIKMVLEGNANRLGEAYPYNYQLSVRRADASLNYLINLGVDKKRLITSALGEGLPEYPTLEENRRLEFIIIENENDLIKYNNFVKNVDIKKEVE